MKTAVVLGNGKSGAAAQKLLTKLGYTVILAEDGLFQTIQEAKEHLFEAELLVSSPGIHDDHPLILLAESLNVKVISELELGFLNCKSNRIVAVTGTNGKTTTVTLLANILSKQNKTFLLGNVGIPFSEKVAEICENDNVVLEVSSYQLEKSHDFNPHVGLLLNITPDHLERHHTMEKYVEVKAKMFLNQTANDFAVFNAEDPLCVEVSKSVKSNALFFSAKRPVKGAFVWKDSIYFENENINRIICKTSDIKIPGNHNVENVLAAVCASCLMEVDSQKTKQAICEFKGVEHRIATVCTVDGVEYINDSKSTNIDSTVVALRAMKKPTIVLLGGFDKGLDFSLLFNEKFSKLKHYVTFGACSNRIYETALKNNFKNITKSGSLEVAIFEAKSIAKKGDVVLLSPACSSFDEFKNFEERGRRFEKIVGEIKKNAKSRSAKQKITKTDN